MRSAASARGFSLIEVVAAIALFVTSIAVILALLPGLILRGAEANDRLVAQQLPDALQVELRRLAAQNFEALAGQAPPLGMPPENGLAFISTRNGSRLHSRDYLAPPSGRIAAADQYYLVECWRFASGPLQFEPTQAALALAVRVSWPYHQPGTSSPTVPDSRHELLFVVGVNR